MQRTIGLALFTEGLTPALYKQVVEQYVNFHPEKELLAYIMGSITDWLKRVVPEDSDKYLMVVAINTANCLAHCDLRGSSNRPKIKVSGLSRINRGVKS